jgi:hypothetical protein
MSWECILAKFQMTNIRGRLSEKKFIRRIYGVIKRLLQGKNYKSVRLVRKVKFIGLVLWHIKVLMRRNLQLVNYFCNINTFMAGGSTECMSLEVYWEFFAYTIMKWCYLV